MAKCSRPLRSLLCARVFVFSFVSSSVSRQATARWQTCYVARAWMSMLRSALATLGNSWARFHAVEIPAPSISLLPRVADAACPVSLHVFLAERWQTPRRQALRKARMSMLQTAFFLARRLLLLWPTVMAMESMLELRWELRLEGCVGTASQLA
jgi:hypothetical protein